MSSPAGYSVSVQRSAPRTLAAVHARVRGADIPHLFGHYLDQVYAAAKSGAVRLDGQNVFLYRPASDGMLDAAFGVGITAPFSAVGNVQPTDLPTGDVATATHMGSYAGIRNAHDAVLAWCRANGRELAGPSWEVYGHWTDNEADLRTDVYWLLR